jgi:3-hydroxyacyl-CoA dehydrogenase/enoyl-CoA hydratase/carnithine racemase
MTATTSVQLSRLENDIACVTLDMPGSSANILSDGMLAELQNCLDEVHEMKGLKGLVLISAKPKIFVAGANLNEINAALDWPDEKIIAFANRGRKIYQAFGEFEFPSVAAIHGACVGGGLELALGCNFRVATSDRRSIVGLPETNLGLIPGWAGTVRIPRLVGLQKGLELIIGGKNLPADQAFEWGIVDQLVESQSELMPAAIALIQSPVNEDLKNHKSCKPVTVAPAEAEKIADSVSAPGFAQQVVKRHIVSSCTLDFEAACDSEALAFAETWGSDESRGLLNNFFLGEHNRKSPGFVDTTLESKTIERVGIVGAGLMGSGIAESCLKGKKQVKIFDVDASVAASTSEKLGGESAGITAVGDFQELADCDLIIESVVEDLAVKCEVLKKLEAVCSPETMLASNTSSIPITELASGLEHSHRVCGIHFCHPGLMKVVEVIRGESTSEETISSAVAFVKGLRKMPIAIQDGPGFVVNRVLSAMLEESVKQLSFGTPHTEIDRAMKDFGFAAGPFEMMDIIGLATCLKAGQIMGRRGVDCVSDSPIVPRMVKRKRLGRKSLAGFYRYETTDGSAIKDPELDQILDGYVDLPTPEDRSETKMLKGACSISGPILASMLRSANEILDAGLVADERDIDLCMIHGLAFPASKGGLLFWSKR